MRYNEGAYRKMKKRYRNKEEIDNIFKNIFWNLKQPWESIFLYNLYNDLDEEQRLIENDKRYRINHPMNTIFTSSEDRNQDFYNFSHQAIPLKRSSTFGFGNIISSDIPDKKIVNEESLTEVIETDKILSITIDLPGFTEENIEFEINKYNVIIKANNGESNYFKEIELPCEVDVESAEISYHNGVLDIIMRKIM